MLTSSNTRRTDSTISRSTILSPSCSHDDVTQASVEQRQKKTLPNKSYKVNETKYPISLSTDYKRTIDGPINVIASIKTDYPRVLTTNLARVQKESKRDSVGTKNLVGTKVGTVVGTSVSGIATVSGSSLERREPPPVPARVFTSISGDTVGKPKRKNGRPSPQQRR